MVNLACNSEWQFVTELLNEKNQREEIGHNDIVFIGTLGILTLGILSCDHL